MAFDRQTDKQTGSVSQSVNSHLSWASLENRDVNLQISVYGAHTAFSLPLHIRPTVRHGTLQMLRLLLLLLLLEVMPVSAGAAFCYDHDQQHSLCAGAL